MSESSLAGESAACQRESDRNQTRTEFAVRVKTRGRFTAHGVAAQCATINHEFNFPPARSRARGAHKNRTNARSRAANFSDNQPRSSPHFHPVSLLAPWSRCSLSLCLFSFLPLLPSPFSIATLRNVFYAPARSYTHAYNVPTPRTVAQELLDRRVLFLLSPPRCRSFSLLSSHSLALSFPSLLPLSLPFKRSPFPARSSSRPGPRIFSRARLSRCNDRSILSRISRSISRHLRGISSGASHLPRVIFTERKFLSRIGRRTCPEKKRFYDVFVVIYCLRIIPFRFFFFFIDARRKIARYCCRCIATYRCYAF